MQHSITFSGSLDFIGALVEFAQEWEGSPAEEGLGTVANFAANQQFQTITGQAAPEPPKKKKETAAEKKKREAEEAANAQAAIVQQSLGQAIPLEPNAAANAHIQQQSQWAAQPIQPGAAYPAPAPQTSFPAAPAPQAAAVQPFVTPQPAQNVVDTTGQAWLNPGTVNAPAGPTLNDVYGLIHQFSTDQAKCQILTNWMAQRLGPGVQLEQLAGQPAILAETYGVVMQIFTGEKTH